MDSPNNEVSPLILASFTPNFGLLAADSSRSTDEDDYDDGGSTEIRTF